METVDIRVYLADSNNISFVVREFSEEMKLLIIVFVVLQFRQIS